MNLPPHYGKQLPSGVRVLIPFNEKDALKTFGNPFEFMKGGQETPNKLWESTTLQTIILPELIPYLIPGVQVKKARFHRIVWPWAVKAFREAHRLGLYDLLAPWGGSYNFRYQSGSGKLSSHAWGISFDINPVENPMQAELVGPLATTERGQQLVQLFEEFGFVWGGRFSRPDPMHFQWGVW